MPTIPAIHANQAPRTSTIAGVAVREDILFMDHKGQEKKGLRKNAEKTLEQLHGVLTRLLEPQETVVYVTQAIAPLSVVEQITLGWYAHAMHSVVLVFTDKRLLRLRVQGKAFGKGWTWTRGVMAVRWGDITAAAAKGWLSHTLVLTYHGGRKETYWRVGFKAKKKLKVLLPALLAAGASDASGAQGMTCLCPDCLQPLTPRVYECAHCGLPFKNETTLLWRNYLLPGGGYIYTGWWVLGTLHAIVDGALMLEMALLILYALRLVAPSPADPEASRTTPESAALALVYLVAAFLLENTVAWWHNRRVVRDFIPAR
jgi:hypothetical protein